MFVGEVFADPESGSPNWGHKSSWIIRKQKPSRSKQEILSPFHCSGSTPLSSCCAVMLSVLSRSWESPKMQELGQPIPMEELYTGPQNKVGHHQKIPTSGIQEIRTALRKTKPFPMFCMSPFEIKNRECCKEIIVSRETHSRVESTEGKKKFSG